LLPIDAKFPHDSFERVVAAAEAGNPEDFLLAPKFT
jgi:DNA anti-recombination protein RmuC